MQTYLVSILLRTNTGRVGLLFCLMSIGASVPTLLANAPDPIEKDTLYVQWAKTKNTLPTLFYELSDFNDFSDRVEAESLIRMYGIGGVVVPNGEIEEVKKWIEGNKSWRKEPILHVASMDQIFELPFQGVSEFPNQLSVTCFTDDSLLYALGLAHAQLLRSMEIGMVQMEELPVKFSVHEWRKVQVYLQGLNDGKISFYFKAQPKWINSTYASNHEWKSKLLSVYEIEPKGVLDKKSLKKYKKQYKDSRIVFDPSTSLDLSLSQMERGVGITLISKQNKPQRLISHLLSEGVPTKGYYKQHVKAYFKLYHDIEKRLIQSHGSPIDWVRLKQRFQLKDIVFTGDLNGLLPFSDLSETDFVTVSSNTVFKDIVDRYKLATPYSVDVFSSPLDSLEELVSNRSVLLVDLNSWEKDEQSKILSLCDSLGETIPILTFLEGNYDMVENAIGNVPMIWNPNDSNSKLDKMVEMAFGARAIFGALPGYFQGGHSRKGIATKSNERLIYSNQVSDVVNHKTLNQIDTLVAHAIQEEMMPGCQIMMIRDGQVVYDKSFGYLTYDSLTAVRWDHVYDIASVTKTVATVPALMLSMDQGEVKLDGFLGDYLTEIDTSKAELLLDDILTHQSGLKSYLPFWRNAKYFSDSASFLYKKRKRRRRYTYHSINWGDSIQSWIGHSSYNSLSNGDGTYRYLYSDLGFMLMKDMVEENCSCTFDRSLDEQVYQPLGMSFTTFNPLEKIPKEQIAPTEQDKFFRSELLRGVVHDKNAALLGGVSGHAGLFSNANDLAKYMQMLVQSGYYGGVRYFSETVVKEFTSKKRENDRRAMGWDKPYASVGNASKYASDESFGHSGFTGTLVWADPKYNLVYIFLSNRIYPDPQNYKLIESNTRTKIHDLMYESFLNVKKETDTGS
ncbi:serine hydrolase domain-containing protein [Reichenbachiella sp.]|uniref:serine hydrolase domain-containing protein n=1 Tax=Reichenbachiella sp. TaxID=2184521 RepID=UPI003B5BAEC4